LPFVITGGGALTFGDLVTKYDSWQVIEDAAGVLKCSGAETPGME